LRAWEKRDRYRPLPGVRPMAWVYTLARNILIDHYRVQQRVDGLEWHADIGAEPTVDDPAPSVARTVELTAAVATLNDKQRAVIVGRFYEGRPFRELGGVASNGGAKKLQERALVNLRRALGAA
jgi:RNA polymerase sigma factor (sigma-70 family)